MIAYIECNLMLPNQTQSKKKYCPSHIQKGSTVPLSANNIVQPGPNNFRVFINILDIRFYTFSFSVLNYKNGRTPRSHNARTQYGLNVRS